MSARTIVVVEAEGGFYGEAVRHHGRGYRCHAGAHRGHRTIEAAGACAWLAHDERRRPEQVQAVRVVDEGDEP